MSETDFNEDELAEIGHLADRARQVSRRKVIKTGKALAFVIPALGAFAVPRQALGGGGSPPPMTGGGVMMLMMVSVPAP